MKLPYARGSTLKLPDEFHLKVARLKLILAVQKTAKQLADLHRTIRSCRGEYNKPDARQFFAAIKEIVVFHRLAAEMRITRNFDEDGTKAPTGGTRGHIPIMNT